MNNRDLTVDLKRIKEAENIPFPNTVFTVAVPTAKEWVCRAMKAESEVKRLLKILKTAENEQNETDKELSLLRDQLSQSQTQVERMREALKPFADSVLSSKDNERPDDEVVDCYFKMGYLRKAKNVLATISTPV